MAQVIKNLGQFAKALEPKIIATFELVAQDVKAEIDEAGTGDFDSLQQVGIDGIVVHGGRQSLSDFAGILAERLGAGKGHVGGPITVFGLLGAFQTHGGTGGADGLKSSGNEIEKGLFLILNHGVFQKAKRPARTSGAAQRVD